MAGLACDVVVVGGGVAGLSCALALVDRGLRAVVLERDAQAGGRARSWRHEATGDMIDIGPHVLHSEYRNFPALLQRLGTRERIAWHDEKLITIVTRPRITELRHRPLTPPFSLLPDFVKMPGLGARDLVSNSRASWAALKFGEEDVPRLDAIPALEFLRGKGATEPMIDRFWRFAAMVVLNVPLEQCSSAALMRVHSQLIGHRRIHFGFPAIGLGDLYVPGAVQAIEASGGRVLTRAHVVELRHEDGRHTAILGGGSRITARHCVLALPSAELGALEPPLATPGFEPSPYVSVYLWFDRKITRERFWSLPWSPARYNYDFYDLSNIREGWSERPSVTASNIIHSHWTHDLDDDAIIAATVREIAEFAPAAREARVTSASVHRIPMAITCPFVGTEAKRPPTRTAMPGVFRAGDWTHTQLPSSMESAASSGFRAAEAVLEDLGRPESIALPPRPNDGFAGFVQKLGRTRFPT